MSMGTSAGHMFRCSVCGELFISDRSNEVAIAESRALWGDTALENLQVVCDECFRFHSISQWEDATGARAKLC